jgi:hypothetical protein
MTHAISTCGVVIVKNPENGIAWLDVAGLWFLVARLRLARSSNAWRHRVMYRVLGVVGLLDLFGSALFLRTTWFAVAWLGTSRLA